MSTEQKSELITCAEVSTTFERPSVHAVVLDGAAILNMLPPGKCKTFTEYAETVFLPYIVNYRAQNVKRIDLVWDRYLENSPKQGTRSSMHLPDAIRCHNFLERVRRPHFKHGSAILRQMKFFVLYHCHRQCSPSSNSECWNASWF